MSEPVQSLLFIVESIVDTVREPLLVLDADLRVMKANRPRTPTTEDIEESQ
jgi:hypothetical protein